MNKKYIVRLTKEEQEYLKGITKKGNAAAYKIRHANILLEADANGPNRTDEQIAKIFRSHVKTIEDIRRRLVEKGLEAAIGRKSAENPPRARKLDGEKEARLIAMSCGTPPKGSGQWTLKLLRDNLIALEIVDDISTETVRKTLKKTS